MANRQHSWFWFEASGVRLDLLPLLQGQGKYFIDAADATADISTVNS